MAATPEMRLALPRRLAASPPTSLAGLAVARIDQSDGFKFYLSGDSWGLLRFSGTEPVLRIFAEADSLDGAEAIAADLAQLANPESNSSRPDSSPKPKE
jgi:phosphomannomutase